MKNISKNDLTFVESTTLRDYELSVTDEHGHTVPLTHQGALAFQASLFSSRRLVVLHPGEEIKQELDLSKLYNFKRHTSYTIRLQRKIIRSDRKWSELIRSNPIKL